MYRNLSLVCLNQENINNFLGRIILIQFYDGTWSLGQNNGHSWTNKDLNNFVYKWEKYNGVYLLPQ